MITLRDKLYESLLDDEDDLINDETELIHHFLKDNYIIKGTYKVNNGVVDVNGDIRVYRDDIVSLNDNGSFKFGTITGDFSLGGADIKTLEGAPEVVNGNFDCSYCNKITSLKGSPKKIGGNFECDHCKELKTLEGSPKEVGGDFDCSTCNKLRNLEGSPQIVKGSFICRSCNKLESLKGLPKKVGKHFQCELCRELDSISPAHDVTDGNVYS